MLIRFRNNRHVNYSVKIQWEKIMNNYKKLVRPNASVHEAIECLTVD